MTTLIQTTNEDKWPIAEGLWTMPDPDIVPERIRPIGRINSLIFHTTGMGKGLLRIYRKYPNDQKKVDCLMARRQANLLEYKPHGSIGPSGLRFQYMPVQYRAHHTAGCKVKKAFRDRLELHHKMVRQFYTDAWLTKRTAWWQSVYPHLATPLDLPCWEAFDAPNGDLIFSPNDRSVALDLIEARRGEAYSEAQLDGLAQMAAMLTINLEIPCDYAHVLDHSRAYPPGRSNARGPWDFSSRFDWRAWWLRLTAARKALGADTVPYGHLVDGVLPVDEVDVMEVLLLLSDAGHDVARSLRAREIRPDGQKALEAFRKHNAYQAHAPLGATSTDLYVLKTRK